MKSYSVIIKEEVHKELMEHLIREDGQEDLCFATYIPSTGATRYTGIISSLILPGKDERRVHGNVGFMPEYFERAISVARQSGEGLVFIHSHPSEGWQGMSQDDIVAENRIAPPAFASTNLPLLGLTAGIDGAWSARFWLKDGEVKRKYNRYWCDSVRVLGKKLTVTYHDDLLPPVFDATKQLRTISAWGSKTQEDISRLRICIVGLGSVGSIVAEVLARTGITHFTLIDFDAVEAKNLDRLTNVFADDIGRAKVFAVADGIRRSASAPIVTIDSCEYSICERQGFEKALNCDIIFSCVDRPWPRQVLNFIAYAHLIPVIDGGILVRTNKTNSAIIGADWKAHIATSTRRCLECLGQYKTSDAVLERTGKLDDPEYIKGLDKSKFIDAHENVFVFSSHLASMEVLQMLSLFIAPAGIADVGQQMYHFVLGKLDVEHSNQCHENCYFQSILGKGDMSGVIVYGQHTVAENSRVARQSALLGAKETTSSVKGNFWQRFVVAFRKFFSGS